MVRILVYMNDLPTCLHLQDAAWHHFLPFEFQKSIRADGYSENTRENITSAFQGNGGSPPLYRSCSLIIGMGCWFQVLAWSSIAQSVGILSAGDSVPEIVGSSPAFNRTNLEGFQLSTWKAGLLSIRYHFPVARASKLTLTNMVSFSI